MLHQEVMQAAENPKGVDELARKLYGSCTFTDEGKVIISDEVNGKQRQCPNRDSALIGAGKTFQQYFIKTSQQFYNYFCIPILMHSINFVTD